MESTSTTSSEGRLVGPASAAAVRVWRLRDLDRVGRLLAAGCVLLLALPFAVSAVRALNDGWVPSGDEAVIAVRVHDTVTGHPPLTGLPSTSDLYGGGIKTRHPGPIEFYVLALPVKLLGPSAGMLLGAGAVNLGSVLLAGWVILRRGGPGLALWGVLLLAATLWSTGSAVLTDPISSNMGGYPTLCLAVLAWALACGDRRLLPVAAVVASYAAQQHLAVVLPVALVSVWGVVGLTWTHLRRSDAVECDPADGVAASSGRTWPWVAGAAGIAAVLWLPVAIDQVTGAPGNISAVLEFAKDSDRSTLGVRSGLTQVLRAASLPPWVLRHDLTGFKVAAPLGPVRVVLGLSVLTTALAVAVLAARRRLALARLGATALVVAAAGLSAGASVPASIEADRINLYRWTWALSLCTLLLIGWLLGIAARHLLARAGEPNAETTSDRHRVEWVAVVVAMLITTAFTYASVGVVGLDDARRDELVFSIDDQLSEAAVGALADREDPTMIVTAGSMATLSVGPAISAAMADAGIEFQVPLRQVDAYGAGRAFDPDSAGQALVVSSSFGPLPEIPGHKLAEADLNPELSAAIDRLVGEVRGAEIVPSDSAPDLLAGVLPSLRDQAESQIARLATDPYAALTTPISLYLLGQGYLDEPELAQEDLQLLYDASQAEMLTVWGDDRVAVHLLTMDELAEFRPELFE